MSATVEYITGNVKPLTADCKISKKKHKSADLSLKLGAGARVGDYSEPVRFYGSFFTSRFFQYQMLVLV